MTISNEAPRSIVQFLTQLAEGAFVAQASEALHALGQRLAREAYVRDGKVKGELSIKLRFTVQPNGLVGVEYDLRTKEPAPKTALGTMWLTEGGNLVPDNPRQQKLPLRDVSAPPGGAPLRDVAKTIAGGDAGGGKEE